MHDTSNKSLDEHGEYRELTDPHFDIPILNENDVRVVRLALVSIINNESFAISASSQINIKVAAIKEMLEKPDLYVDKEHVKIFKQVILSRISEKVEEFKGLRYGEALQNSKFPAKDSEYSKVSSKTAVKVVGDDAANLPKKILVDVIMQQQSGLRMNTNFDDQAALSKLGINELEDLLARNIQKNREGFSSNSEQLEQYGDKHANLMRLVHLFNEVKLPGVVVPMPHGLTSNHVEEFLRHFSPELFEHWHALGNLYTKYVGSDPFLEQPEPKKLLSEIGTAIEKAFQLTATDDFICKRLIPEDFFAWLQMVHNNHTFLIVRSTGAEDSRQTANAGGNISRSYVDPTPQAISKAMGDVVCSYFSYSSLQNRLNANINPFEHDLKLAVTVQELIGEPVGGAKLADDIPVSLVLFTSEPLYVGGEEFRLMRLSATPGHGEGVVGNQGISSDTTIILVSSAHPDQLYVLSDNQLKPYRLAPIATDKGIELQKIANPSHLKNESALSPDMLSRLYVLGVVAEKFFAGQPTDLEIVIKNGQIFPVQARPINRPDLLPTYLDLKKVAAQTKNSIIQTIHADTVVPGKGSVVIIENPNELLTMHTLEEAEKLFRSNMHKIVIVADAGPANSHPIVNFSGLGMPCLACADQKQLQGLSIGKNRPLVVDVQTGAIYLWDAEVALPSTCISEGFAVHPAKIAVSLPIAASLPPPIEKQAVPQEVKSLLLAIRSASSAEVALAKLKELQRSPWIQKVQQRQQKLTHKIENMAFTPTQVTEGRELLIALTNAVERAFDETKSVWQNMQKEERLHPLLHAKVIETLVTTSPKKQVGISQYSIVDVKPIYRDIKALIDYQNALPHKANFSDLFLLKSQATSPECEEAWVKFLSDLEPSVNSKEISQVATEQFKQTMHMLKETNMLPTWFALHFPKFNQPGLDPSERLQQLLDSLPAADIPFRNHLMEMNDSLKEGQNRITQCGHPNTFEEGWKWLNSQIQGGLWGDPKDPSLFAKGLKECSPLCRDIALKVLGNLVETCDLSIKAMKMGTDWSPEEKTALFKKMLIPYLSILLDWGSNIQDTASIPTNKNWPLPIYLTAIKNQLLAMPDSDPMQLGSTAHFSVAAAMLGSGTAFERHFPGHLEDVFTLIHQNLLFLLSHLNNAVYDEASLQQANLPAAFKSLFEKIDSQRLGRKIQRQTLEITSSEIVAKYNIPLRNHSSGMHLHYNRLTKEVTLKGALLGRARDRWFESAFLLRLLDKLGSIKLSNPLQLGDQELHFTWKLEKGEQLDLAMQELNYLLELSLVQISEALERDFMQRRDIKEETLNDLYISELENKETWPLLRDNVAERLLNSRSGAVDFAILNAIKQLSHSRETGMVRKLHNHLLELLKRDCGAEVVALKIAKHWTTERDLERYAFSIFLVFLQENQANAAAIEVIVKQVQEWGLFSDERLEWALRLIPMLKVQGKDVEGTFEIGIRGLLNEKSKMHALSMGFLPALFVKASDDDSLTLKAKTVIELAESNPNSVLRLCTSLLEAEVGYELASQIASQEILKALTILDKERDDELKKNASSLLENAQELFKALFAKGFGYKEAVDTAVQATLYSRDKEDIAEILFIDVIMAKQHELALEGLKPFMEHPKSLRLFKFIQILVEESGGYEMATQAATQAFKVPAKVFAALPLFESLVIKGQAFDVAIEAATTHVKDTYLHKEVCALLKALVEKKMAYDVALQALQECKSPNELSLFNALLVQGQGYVEAERVAVKQVQSNDPADQMSALKLFRSLVSQGQAFEAAIREAAKAVEDEDSLVANYALQLFQALVAIGQGFEEATTAAIKGCKNEEIRDTAFELFQALVTKGQSFEAALQEAKRGVNSGDQKTMALFNTLVAQGQGVDSAIGVVSKAAKSKMPIGIGRRMLALAKALLDRGQGIEAAIQLAGNIQAGSIVLIKDAVDLIKALVAQGQKEALLEELKNRHSSVPQFWKPLLEQK